MDLSAAPHQLQLHFPHQEMGSHSDSQSLDSMIVPDPNSTQNQNQNQNQNQDQKKPRPPDGEPQSCPRCDSTNTKFCYYNNYSLTQPRYFCKACRRYWTKGGTLRNVPVGGGCRKSSKRSSAASSPSLSPSHFLKRPHNRDTIIPTMVAGPTPLFSNFSSHAYSGGLGMGFDGVEQDLDLPMSSRALLDHHSFLQQLQYGNGAGLMFQNMCSYEEAGCGNSNCVSGISEDMAVAASMAPYEEVKQERGEDGALWGLPWQMINGENGSLMGGGGDLESIRENNWNGLMGNSTWGLLNTPALM